MPWEMKPVTIAESSLIEAFLDLYQSCDYREITVGQIVDKAGYSRGTFYKYFDSKEDILLKLAYRTVPWNLIETTMREISTVPLEDATDRVIGYFEKRSSLVRLLLQSPVSDEYLTLIYNAAKPLYRGLVERAYDMDPYLLDFFAERICVTKGLLLRHWALKDNSYSLRQLNKIEESLIESSFWSRIAMQAPKHGGPKERIRIEDVSLDYPWIDDNHI